MTIIGVALIWSNLYFFFLFACDLYFSFSVQTSMEGRTEKIKNKETYFLREDAKKTR